MKLITDRLQEFKLERAEIVKLKKEKRGNRLALINDKIARMKRWLNELK